MQETGFLRWARLLCRQMPSLALFAMICLFVTTLLLPASSQAQTSSSDPMQALQSLLQGSANGSSSGLGVSNAPTTNTNPLTLLPSYANPVPLPTSRLEQIMSQRASSKLTQFGYDLVGTGQVVSVPQTGAVADNYLLGPGDELTISFRGQENSEYTVDVGRDGTVALPRLSPINVSGHTLGEFRQQLAGAVKRTYVSTQAFATINRLRQVSVVVAGDVYIPGTRLVTGLSTALDAILLSGGIKKTGSLRNIVLVRGNQRTTVDLYDLLTQRGNTNSLLLTDGDKIVVPPIGRTVAVSGWVRRPGIYELPAGSAQISTSALVRLAGGLEVRGRYRLAVLRVEQNGTSALVALPGGGGTIRDSEILFVQPDADQTQKQATLSGGTPLAGVYSVGHATSLADMLRSPGALGPNPYTLFGVVARKDPSTMLRTLVPFTPIAVVRGSENLSLASDDIVRVFSADEDRMLTAVVEAFVARRQAAEQALRAPTSGDLYNQPQAPVVTTTTNGINTTSSITPPKVTQQQQNQNSNAIPNTERQDIAELSVQTLGDGGILTTNAPSNGYAPYSSVPSPNNSPGSSGAVGQSPSLATTAQPQSPALAASQSQQNSTSSQNLPSSLYLQSLQAQQMTTGAGGQNLPPNFQRQDIVPGQVPSNDEVQTFGQLARQLNVDPLMLVHFLMDRTVTVDGAVHGPGTFFVGPAVTVADLVSAAGGTQGWVDRSGVEFITTDVDTALGRSRTSHRLISLNDTTQASLVVRPRDQIRLHAIDTVVGAGSVTLQGQVRYPGTYQFERGERLSELLLRAGGLTDVAYPYGTVFLRKSAADIERESYIRAARDLENQIAAGITLVGNDKTPPEALSQMQAFIYELRTTTPLGRISVMADPARLASDPSLDVLLEDGDVIYVPQRSSTISVMGEVLQPGAFPFSPKMSAKDYVARAGGYSQFAEDSLTFVVLPDGSARQLDSSWLNLDDPTLPPGSTIVVPRNAAILDTRQIILDITAIFRDLAVGAASLAVLSRN